MHKFLAIALMAMTTSLFANQVDIVHLNNICEEGKLDSITEERIEFVQSTYKEGEEDKDYITLFSKEELVDLCRFIQERSQQNAYRTQALSFEPDKKRKWKIIFNFGPFVAYYRPINLQLRGNNTDLRIDNLQPIQRTSFGHYQFWDSSETNIGQFLDEPQNRFNLEFSNDSVFFGIEYLHPKVLYHDLTSNQHVNLHGTLNGKEIDIKDVPLSDYFYEISSTFGNAHIEAFAGKIIKLFPAVKGHKIRLHVGLGAGLTVASGQVTQIEIGGERASVIRINGYAISMRHALRYSNPNDRFSISLGYDVSFNSINGSLGDYEQTTTMLSERLSLTLGLRLDGLFKPRKRPKKPGRFIYKKPIE